MVRVLKVHHLNVKKYGMINNVTWISFSSTCLEYVKKYHNKARLGLCCTLSTTAINTVKSLKNDVNEVFVDADVSSVTEALVSECIQNDLPLEVWTVNSETAIINTLNPYVSGVTSDSLHAGKVLYNNAQ